MIKVFYLQLVIYSKEIAYQFDASNMDIDLWKTKGIPSPYFQQCNNNQILGGPGLNSAAIIRNFLLQPHYLVYIDIEFYRIDSWDNDYLIIKLEDSTIYQQQFNYQSGTNLCGDSAYDDEIITIQITSKHTSNLAVVQINTLDINNDNNESWGIKYFTLSIEPCPYGCQYCESDDFIQCKQWSLQYWDQNVNVNYWFGNPLYSFYYYDQVCSYTLTLPQHTKLMMKFRVYLWSVNDVNIDIIIDNEVHSSLHKMSTLLFNAQFEIIIPFFNHIKNSISIQLQRTGGSQPQLKLKDFQILLQKDHELTNFYSPDDVSKDGWIYDIEFFIPQCGDQLIVGQEQCDDGNDIPYDGCYLCKFQCVLNCNYCKFGVCELCQQGYLLDISNNCIPICGDGLIIPYQEQCDDLNNDQFDGCFNCQFECSNNCIYCIDIQCLQCERGYSINALNCEPMCGDGIIIHEFEECDDGNQLQYDGCYLCKYQCQLNCQLCIEGKCKDQCLYGDIIIDSQCHSVCGNKIVSQLEECDDGNSIQYDGCYQCMFQCPLNCNLCEQGLCLECEYNYKLQNNECQSIEICGNGMIGDLEQCDDENLLQNDGCSQECKIEEDWMCNDSSPSECLYLIRPKMIVTLVNSTFEIQFLQIEFSQPIKIQNLLIQTCSIQVLNVIEQNQNVTIYTIEEATTQISTYLSRLNYELETTSYNNYQLTYNYNNLIYFYFNQFDLPLLNPKVQITLEPIDYLNQKQKEQTQQLSGMNISVIYILAAISLFSLILGDSSIFSEIINVLQYYSYLKYINIRYPQNLYYSLKHQTQYRYKFIVPKSINPFLYYIPVNKLLSFIIQSDEMLPSKGKFLFYEQEADLINNLTCQILQIIAILLMNLYIQLLKKLFYKPSYIKKYIYCTSLMAVKLNSDIAFKLIKGSYKMIKQVLSIKFGWQGLKDLLLINSWDLLFKVFLYINSMKISNLRDYIQISLTLILLLLYFILIFNCNNTITLCRQIIFLILLVFVQFNQIYQTLFLSLTNVFYFIILMTSKKIQSNTNFTQKLIEGIITCFTLTSAVYFEDFRPYLDQEKRVQMGFMHIGLLCVSLAAKVIQYTILIIRRLVKYVNKQLVFRKKVIQQAPDSLFF